MQKAIPVAEYQRIKYPSGKPTLQTLRNWIDRNDPNLIDGYSVTVGSRKIYFVNVQDNNDPEVDEILSAIG